LYGICGETLILKEKLFPAPTVRVGTRLPKRTLNLRYHYHILRSKSKEPLSVNMITTSLKELRIGVAANSRLTASSGRELKYKIYIAKGYFRKM